MERLNLPAALQDYLGHEKIDFAVTSKRAHPLTKSLSTILLGFFMLSFTSIFLLFIKEGATIEGNLTFKLVIGLFAIIGVVLVISGTKNVFKGGGWFVGTPQRLVNFQNNEFHSIDWEQFNGDIKLSGGQDRGDLVMNLRTGKMVSKRRGPERYVPDKVYFCAVPDVKNVERICRQRIKEHDPTPVTQLASAKRFSGGRVTQKLARRTV